MDIIFTLIALGSFLVLVLLPVFCFARFACAIFSPKLRKTIRQKWRSHALLAASSLAIVVLLLLSEMYEGPPLMGARVAKSKNQAANIKTAILNYETEYSVPPSSNDNASLARILTGESVAGDNPRKIAFLSLSQRDMNTKGEMIDAWGKPFQISMADPTHPFISSDTLRTLPAVVAKSLPDGW